MITRRQVLQATGTFAGYALAVETAFAQVIKTDTSGLTTTGRPTSPRPPPTAGSAASAGSTSI